MLRTLRSVVWASHGAEDAVREAVTHARGILVRKVVDAARCEVVEASVKAEKPTTMLVPEGEGESNIVSYSKNLWTDELYPPSELFREGAMGQGERYRYIYTLLYAARYYF